MSQGVKHIMYTVMVQKGLTVLWYLLSQDPYVLGRMDPFSLEVIV